MQDVPNLNHFALVATVIIALVIIHSARMQHLEHFVTLTIRKLTKKKD